MWCSFWCTQRSWHNLVPTAVGACPQVLLFQLTWYSLRVCPLGLCSHRPVGSIHTAGYSSGEGLRRRGRVQMLASRKEAATQHCRSSWVVCPHLDALIVGLAENYCGRRGGASACSQQSLPFPPNGFGAHPLSPSDWELVTEHPFPSQTPLWCSLPSFHHRLSVLMLLF